MLYSAKIPVTETKFDLVKKNKNTLHILVNTKHHIK